MTESSFVSPRFLTLFFGESFDLYGTNLYTISELSSMRGTAHSTTIHVHIRGVV